MGSEGGTIAAKVQLDAHRKAPLGSVAAAGSTQQGVYQREDHTLILHLKGRSFWLSSHTCV